MKLLVAIFFIFISGSSWAQVPAAAGLDRQLYTDLMQDFYEEILTMAEAQENQSAREKAVSQLKAAFQNSDPEQLRFHPSRSWAWAWPPKKDFSTSNIPIQFEQIMSPAWLEQGVPHSIQNLDAYIRARLGSTSASLIKQGKIVPLVLGGSEASLAGLVQVPEKLIFKLPSLYENWGIKRYYISGQAFENGKPHLVYLIPPATEYLEHYQLMISELTGKKAAVQRSKNDFENWKQDLAEGTRILGRKLGGQFDYVTLGYYKQWPQVLEKSFRILASKQMSLLSGHEGRYIKIRNRESGQVLRLLNLGHSQTIWGEASAHLIEGAFDFRPRGIVFLGSAGSISNKSQIYEVSAPLQFRTKQRHLEIGNILQLGREILPAEVPIRFDAIHGNTSSPAAQTLGYLVKHHVAGVDTLDVEQSLVAEKIEEYNRRHSTKILFGAANLITDKPLSHSENDLDRIDHGKKAKARLAAIQLTLKSLSLEKARPTQCGRVW